MGVVRAAGVILAAALAAAPAHAAQFALEYDASILNVVELGKVTLKGAIAASGYNAAASVQTAGFARLFDDTRISVSSAGHTGASGLSWVSYDLAHSYGRKFRRVSMRRGAQSVGVSITPTYREWGSPPASAAQQMSARDPLSTIVELGRSVGVSGKCAGSYPTFDGRQYYVLTFVPKANGAYAGGGYDGKALVCALRYQPVAGFKRMTAADRAKIPQAEIWFAVPAKGGFATPLRVEIPTPLGAARLDLARYAAS